jgi:hypothetical protein
MPECPSEAGRANSKKDLVTRPIRGFCALQGSDPRGESNGPRCVPVQVRAEHHPVTLLRSRRSRSRGIIRSCLRPGRWSGGWKSWS